MPDWLQIIRDSLPEFLGGLGVAAVVALLTWLWRRWRRKQPAPEEEKKPPQVPVTIGRDVIESIVATAGRDVYVYPPSPKEAPPPFQLPPDLATFTGREEHLAELDALLHPDGGTMVALVGLRGMAGVGKSVLGIHAAHHWRDRFPDGIVWVDLRRRDVAGALRHMAASYGYGDHAAKAGDDPAGLASLARSILHDKQALVILDNAEGVDPAQFELLLPGGPGPVVLVTSRRSFPALERQGRVLRVDVMGEDEALDLLAEILGPAEDEARRARWELCRRLGYLPLALDIAARWMQANRWKVEAMLERLADEEKRLDELALPLAEGPEASVAVSFGLSYRALSEGDQRLFRGLGIFAEGGFTPTAVAGVLGLAEAEAQRGLERLAALSLARPAEQPGRCDLHPLLADYARALVRQVGEWETLAHRHAEYFLAYARQFKEDFNALEAEHANLLAAMDRAYELESWEVVIRLMWGLDDYLYVRGYWNEYKRRLAQAAEAARRLGDRENEAAFVGNAAIVAQSQGDYQVARQLHEQCAEMRRQQGDQRNLAAVLHQLGMLAQDTGDYDQARRLYTQAAVTFEALGAKSGLASNLAQTALLEEKEGNIERAIELTQQAEALLIELGNPEMIERARLQRERLESLKERMARQSGGIENG